MKRLSALIVGGILALALLAHSPGTAEAHDPNLRMDGNGRLVAYHASAEAAQTGTGAALTYTNGTFDLPGGFALLRGKCLRIDAASLKTGTNSTVYRILFGATVVQTWTASGTTGVEYRTSVRVCNNTGSVTVQQGQPGLTYVVAAGAPTLLTSSMQTTPAENTDGGTPITIKFDFNVANTSSSALLYFDVNLE